MRLVSYMITIILSSLLLTAGVTWFVNKGLKRSVVDFYGKVNVVRDSSKNTDLLLVGSSRALVQLDTRVFDSVTGLNSYNLGLNAAKIRTTYNLLKLALQFQKKVKVVVMNIDFNMFSIADDPYKDAYYYPFEKNVNGLILDSSGYYAMVHKVGFLDASLYDDYAKYAALDGWLRPGRNIPGVYKGFYPYSEPGFTAPLNEQLGKAEVPFSEETIQILNKIIDLCRSQNIYLVFVVAPYYEGYFPGRQYSNYQHILDKVKNIAKANNISFLDHGAGPISNDRSYFYNAYHLNSKGARAFSLVVANSIKHRLAVH